MTALSFLWKSSFSRRRHKTDARTMQRVVQAFRPYVWQIVLILLAILLTTGLGLVNPFMIQFIFDDAIGKRNLHLLLLFVSIMLVTPILNGFIGVGQTYLNTM